MLAGYIITLAAWLPADIGVIGSPWKSRWQWVVFMRERLALQYGPGAAVEPTGLPRNLYYFRITKGEEHGG